MEKFIITRVEVPEHLKVFYFSNDTLQEEYSEMFKTLLLTRLEALGNKELMKKWTSDDKLKYKNYIEISHPNIKPVGALTVRKNCGRRFEELFRSAVKSAYKRQLYFYVRVHHQSGYKLRETVCRFMLEHGLSKLKEYDEQKCLDDYYSAKKHFEKSTRFRKLDFDGI